MISILTPTYNRAYLLPTLYKSLLKQTSRNFEWIIIDDGSTDNTQDLVREWINQTESFEIRYLYQENGGKHRAINQGVKLVRYSYCFIVDSDDFIIETAIEKIINWINTINDDTSFAGISGLKGYIGGGQVGGYPPDKKFLDYIDASNLERRKYNLGGDKAEVYRTKILKDYPFPEFEGENYLSEAIVWDAIARDGYKIRWFNEIIYRCDYIGDGITKMGETKLIDNFIGYTHYVRQSINLHSGVFKIFMMGNYFNIAKQKGYTSSEAAASLRVNKGLLFISYTIWNINNFIKQVKTSINNVFNKIKGKAFS